MKEHKTYDVYYDEEADFLEVSFEEPAKKGTTEEVQARHGGPLPGRGTGPGGWPSPGDDCPA